MGQRQLEFLNYIKEKHGLSDFDGRQLCQYKLSKKDYVELEEIVTVIDYTDRLKINPATSGLFVLYCSERWRRYYTEGVWSWDFLLEKFNQKPKPHKVISTLVKTGLKRFNREVVQGQNYNNYLGTIVLEAGLPVNKLTDGAIARVLETSYRSFLQNNFYLIDEKIKEIESISARKRLSDNLQNETFYLLVKNFVEVLIDLNDKYDLEDLNDQTPIDYLDGSVEGWKNQLPIVLESEQAKKFVNKLISKVTEISKEVSKKIKINYHLKKRPHKDVWFLETQLNIKKGIYGYDFLGLSLADYKALSSRSRLKFVSKSGERLIGFIDKKDPKENNFLVQEFNEHTLSESMDDQGVLVISDLSGKLSIEIPVELNLFSDTIDPHLFVQKDSKWIYKSSGTTNISEDRCKVLVSGESIEVNGEQTENFESDHVKLFDVTKSTELIIGDNMFYIGLSSKDNSASYRFARKKSSSFIPVFVNDNKNIFLGEPLIYRLNSIGKIVERSVKGVQYLSSNGWKTYDHKVYGKFKIRKLDRDGRTLFTKTINVLPEDFRLNFEEDGILIETAENIGIRASKELQFETNRRLSIADEETNQAVLSFKNNEVNNWLCLKTIVPNKQNYFANSQGESLRFGWILSIKNLYGYSFVAKNLSDRLGTKSFILKLISGDKEVVNRTLVFEIPSLSYSEIPLIRFKETMERMFSVNSYLDSYIEISHGNSRVCIKKFTTKPSFDNLNQGFQFSEKVNEVSVLKLNSSIEEGAFKNVRIDSHFICSNDLDDGLWLIYPNIENEDFFRPVVLRVGEGVGEGVESLSSNLTIAEISNVIDYDERQQRFKDYLLNLSADYSNGGWAELFLLYKKTKHLPMEVLDIWKAAVNSPQVLTSFIMKFTPEFIDQLTEEFSIIWRLISLREWRNSIGLLKKSLEDLPIPENVKDEIVNSKISFIRNQLEIHSIADYIDLNTETQSLPFQVLQHVIQTEINGAEGVVGLRNRHAHNSKWPEALAPKINDWRQLLPEDFRGLVPHINTYEKPIVWLPIVLAYTSFSHDSVITLSESDLVRYNIIESKEFDRHWFQYCFDLVNGYLLQEIN